MNSIYIIRDALRGVYSRYGAFIKPVLKIVLAFLMLTVIQKNIGYNATLSKPLYLCAASVLCAFFPSGCITFVCAAFVLADMFEVSMLMAGFSAVIALLIFVLYFGYRPGSGIIIALVPLMFHFKLPYVVPLLLGLGAGFYSAVPAALGVLCWNILQYFSANFEALSEGSTAELASLIMQMAKNILMDEYMFLIMFAFSLCIAAVSILSRSSINHCWVISVSAGTVILAFVMVLGGSYLGRNDMMMELISLVISYLIAVAYVYLIYSVDFKSTEHLSYEDDDYYYYVKAVPKIHPYQGDREL